MSIFTTRHGQSWFGFEVTGNEGRSIAPISNSGRAAQHCRRQTCTRKINLNAAVRRARFRDLPGSRSYLFCRSTNSIIPKPKFSKSRRATILAENGWACRRRERFRKRSDLFAHEEPFSRSHFALCADRRQGQRDRLRDLFARPGDSHLENPRWNATVPINSTFFTAPRPRSWLYARVG